MRIYKKNKKNKKKLKIFFLNFYFLFLSFLKTCCQQYILLMTFDHILLLAMLQSAVFSLKPSHHVKVTAAGNGLFFVFFNFFLNALSGFSISRCLFPKEGSFHHRQCQKKLHL